MTLTLYIFVYSFVLQVIETSTKSSLNVSVCIFTPLYVSLPVGLYQGWLTQ